MRTSESWKRWALFFLHTKSVQLDKAYREKRETMCEDLCFIVIDPSDGLIREAVARGMSEEDAWEWLFEGSAAREMPLVAVATKDAAARIKATKDFPDCGAQLFSAPLPPGHYRTLIQCDNDAFTMIHGLMEFPPVSQESPLAGHPPMPVSEAIRLLPEEGISPKMRRAFQSLRDELGRDECGLLQRYYSFRQKNPIDHPALIILSRRSNFADLVREGAFGPGPRRMLRDLGTHVSRLVFWAPTTLVIQGSPCPSREPCPLFHQPVDPSLVWVAIYAPDGPCYFPIERGAFEDLQPQHS